MWNTNRCQAKALESVRLRACKYTLGCSVTTCDEPVCTDLGLKTWRNGRDFSRLKWCCKVVSRNDEGLPFKLLTNEWDVVNCKGRPRKSWLTRVDFLKERIGSPRPSLGRETNQKSP